MKFEKAKSDATEKFENFEISCEDRVGKKVNKSGLLGLFNVKKCKNPEILVHFILVLQHHRQRDFKGGRSCRREFNLRSFGVEKQ